MADRGAIVEAISLSPLSPSLSPLFSLARLFISPKR